jgi:hypothetical protein
MNTKLRIILVLGLLVAACAFTTTAAQSATTTQEQQAQAESAASDGIDLTQLPIGDGKYSTSAKRGYVWSCQTNFVNPNQAGASATGAWYNAAAGTYNLTLKPTVDGQVSWPSQFAITVQGSSRVITGNDLPSHTTGQYPVSSSDDAYRYDRNPNRISAQTLRLTLPANPTLNAQPSCVGGMVGVMLTGSYIFNAFDAGGRDAVAHEIQDACGGHPQQSGVYHYHSLSPCATDAALGHSALVGYALDGFGLYGHHGENGKALTNADLDECHGHTHEIEWDGTTVEMYHYHATAEFPYTISCFRGSAVRVNTGGGGQGGTGGQQQQGGGQFNGGGQPGAGIPPSRPNGIRPQRP